MSSDVSTPDKVKELRIILNAEQPTVRALKVAAELLDDNFEVYDDLFPLRAKVHVYPYMQDEEAALTSIIESLGKEEDEVQDNVGPLTKLAPLTKDELVDQLDKRILSKDISTEHRERYESLLFSNAKSGSRTGDPEHYESKSFIPRKPSPKETGADKEQIGDVTQEELDAIQKLEDAERENKMQ